MTYHQTVSRYVLNRAFPVPMLFGRSGNRRVTRWFDYADRALSSRLTERIDIGFMTNTLPR